MSDLTTALAGHYRRQLGPKPQQQASRNAARDQARAEAEALIQAETQAANARRAAAIRQGNGLHNTIAAALSRQTNPTTQPAQED